MLAYRFIELKKFGFNTFNGGSEYMYDIKDLREHPDMDSAFVKAFWGNLNSTRDDMLDIYEVKASYNIKETRRDIARMVCKHKIEWSYTKEEVSKEVTKFYDFLISKEDPGMKDALEGLVKQELDAIKVQVSKLMFWNEAAGLASPPPKEEKEESKVQISRGFRGHPELSIMRRDDKFSAEKGEAYTLADSSSSAPAPAALDVAPASGDTKEENPKPPGRIFPQNPNVYHFHPIAFVRQMKLMFEQGTNECTCEARVRAFLRLLKWTEGTEKEGDDAYRTLFSFKKFDDYSKYPMDVVKASGRSSSAAGAYQINIACYKTLQGYYKNKLNQWEQNKKKDYITKYKLNGFTPLEQDKMALLILIYKKKGLINDIINKEFSKALRQHASYEWASLPPKRYNQPVKTFEEVSKRYKKYFEEELEGNTNLHLKEGFLKEFGVKCSCESSSDNENCTCGQKHIDLTDKMIFYDQGSGNQNCNITCKAIMSQMGVIAEGATETNRHSFYQLALENSAHSKLVFVPEKIKAGMSYLNNSLDKNEPVLVGVNHTLNGGINNESDIQTTDHYVIIVGRKCMNNKIYYQYWDVGTMHGSKESYRFELQDNGILINENGYGGSGKPDGRKYTVTQIRRNSKVKI